MKILLALPLIQEEQLSVNGESMYTKSGKLPLEDLPSNSVGRITDHPDMTSAVYHGHRATNQTNKQTNKAI